MILGNPPGICHPIAIACDQRSVPQKNQLTLILVRSEMSNRRRGLCIESERLRTLRTARGLTQRQLAELADCSVRTIRNAEQGRGIDPSTLRAIAQALATSPATLIRSSPEPRREKVPTTLPRQHPAEQSLQQVERWHNAFRACDAVRLMALHTQDTILELPGATELAGADRFVGWEAVRQHYFDTFATFRLLAEQIKTMDVAESLVLERVEATFVAISTRREFTTKFYHEFELAGGLIRRRLTISDLTPHRRALGIDS